MRIDKYLKVSRLIKRRTVAAEACDQGRISVNGKIVKPSYDVKIDDVITIKFGERELKVKVTKIAETVKKDDAATMFEAVM
ncbi:MAG: RNA-binding S4 domain-containing protein [Clostridia bacterium]|nr:RNA-binding S4 domain-containing protein [Clostridia bacterium]